MCNCRRFFDLENSSNNLRRAQRDAHRANIEFRSSFPHGVMEGGVDWEFICGPIHIIVLPIPPKPDIFIGKSPKIYSTYTTRLFKNDKTRFIINLKKKNILHILSSRVNDRVIQGFILTTKIEQFNKYIIVR